MTVDEIKVKILNGEIDDLTEVEKERYCNDLFETETKEIAINMMKKLGIYNQGTLITLE